jgi:5-formyltetrahydrofolate cyclo-ligase
MQSVNAELAALDEKRRLRAELRALRRTLDASALARAARRLEGTAATLPALAAARTVAGYVACDGELDVAPILDAARARGARVALPRCRADAGLELVPVAAGERLAPVGARGRVPEPSGPPCDPAALPSPALVLVPSVALDRSGLRLGRGGGDYDRLLPVLRAGGWTIVGVCHAAALRDALPVEPHDVRVDAILTDDGLIVPAR